ncbi:peptide ABC transporter substrate-binding protein [Shimazuella sp. AN120528]|uniref:peptide ABC transporter substrate-binding protein n=1 Tax=Shimazuella soli TaxID=1892854 RepID=UPI001F10F030|nr:peptide ABC transporter substrate-binding protein [Shimazuella soli]MCH5584623.1 peptide ABC transporter substrate-binding protein [Shimazuella soli]
MSKKKWSLFTAIILVLSMVLAACGGGGTDEASKNTLVLTDKSEPPNLDSAKSTDQVSFQILTNSLEGLMRLDKNLKPAPGIAKSYEVSSDKLTYTFHLRDAKWSDGKAVTANDFEYAWKRALDPKTASEYAYILEPVKNAMEYNAGKAKAEDVGVKALDAKTLQVTLKAPSPYFLELTTFSTFMPQREDIVKKYGDKFALEAQNMVYDGPFSIDKWEHGVSVHLTKNSNYWDAKNVKLANAEVKFLNEESTRVNLYKTNKIDFTEITKDFADAFKSNPERFVLKESSAWYLELNQREGFLKNKKLRQAIELAIDKKTLTDAVLKTGSTPAGALVPPDIHATGDKKFRDISKEQVTYDPKKAKQLWEEGLKEEGLKNPVKIDLLGDNTTNAKDQMDFISDQLEKNLGVNVTVSAVTFKERLQRGKDGNFQLLLSGWGADYNDAMSYLDIFTTGQSYNRGKWSNAEYDALIQKSKNNPNFEARIQDLAKAEKILIDDQGIAPLYYRTRLSLLKPYVKGAVWNTTWGFFDLKGAYLDGK